MRRNPAPPSASLTIESPRVKALGNVCMSLRLCCLYVSSPSYYSRQRHVLQSTPTFHAPLYPVSQSSGSERLGLGLAYGPIIPRTAKMSCSLQVTSSHKGINPMLLPRLHNIDESTAALRSVNSFTLPADPSPHTRPFLALRLRTSELVANLKHSSHAIQSTHSHVFALILLPCQLVETAQCVRILLDVARLRACHRLITTGADIENVQHTSTVDATKDAGLRRRPLGAVNWVVACDGYERSNGRCRARERIDSC
jgi:hypothetical protein